MSRPVRLLITTLALLAFAAGFTGTGTLATTDPLRILFGTRSRF